MLPDPVGEEKEIFLTDASSAKKPKLLEEESPISSTNGGGATKEKVKSDIIDDGEAVEVEKEEPKKMTADWPKSAEELNPDLVEDGREICPYDEECYRKNPAHFKQMRHPKLKENRRVELEALRGGSGGASGGGASEGGGVSVAKGSTGGAGGATATTTLRRMSSSGVGLSAAQVATTTVRPEMELYKSAMKTVLGGASKVTSEGRKLLKMFRQNHSVTEVEHDQLLGQFGWTPDEYEDGEKNQATYELDEERDFLRAAAANGQADAFKIFTLYKHQKRNEQQESVWARATSKFYQTMSKAQANFVIKSIGLVVNAKVSSLYDARRASMLASASSKPGAKPHATNVNEEWGFHGTSEASIQGIAATGFKMPDELKKLQKGLKAPKKSAAAASGSTKVTFLDDGFFGAGLYFSLYSDYALFYSEERGSSQILLCKVLTGKAFKCSDRMDGEGLQAGFDSHYSPQGNEIIVFRGDQVLPRYIITFEQRDAVEREQED